jgi:hypothetical protein
MNLREDWKGIASGVATAITTFWAIQEIAKNYGVAITMPTSYLSVLAFVGLTVFPIWLGYQIRGWFESKMRKPSAPETMPASIVPVIHSDRQFKYRNQVRDNLVGMRTQLYNINLQENIQFESWNAFMQPDQRKEDIHDDAQYLAIQNFSTILNKRNNHLNDPMFPELNDECIALYVKIKATGFLDVADPLTQGKVVPKAVELDHRFDHVQVYLFYPFHYCIPHVSKRLGLIKRVDPDHLLRIKLMVNLSTKIAYPFGDVGWSLLSPTRRVQYNSEVRWLRSNLEKWCKRKGFTMSPSVCTMDDLLACS